MTSPGPLFVDLINNIVNNYTKPHMGQSTGPTYLGDTPPISPEVFRSRCEEILPLYKPNAWDNFADTLLVINAAVAFYAARYKAWVSVPLAADAPAEVVAWQRAAQGNA